MNYIKGYINISTVFQRDNTPPKNAVGSRYEHRMKNEKNKRNNRRINIIKEQTTNGY